MDWNTKRRQDELNAWQKASLNQILGATRPIGLSGGFWRAIETVMFWIGLWGIALVLIWVLAAFLGCYWEMAESGFAFGRNFLRWLLELPR